MLYAHRVEIPSKTKVAAVGETTAAALHAVGYDVALMPELDNSAAGMAEKIISIEPDAQRILTLRSEIAKPVLSVMLTEAGHDVDSVVAYRTVGVPVSPSRRTMSERRDGCHQRRGHPCCLSARKPVLDPFH